MAQPCCPDYVSGGVPLGYGGNCWHEPTHPLADERGFVCPSYFGDLGEFYRKDHVTDLLPKLALAGGALVVLYLLLRK